MSDMKIIEHNWQPGVIGFLDENRGKRSYWFSAHNLFEAVIDNEEAIDFLLHWSAEEIEFTAQTFITNEENWLDYDDDHEMVIGPNLE
jgi:hypothetical protein